VEKEGIEGAEESEELGGMGSILGNQAVEKSPTRRA